MDRAVAHWVSSDVLRMMLAMMGIGLRRVRSMPRYMRRYRARVKREKRDKARRGDKWSRSTQNA